MAEYIEREKVLANAVFVHGKWDDTYVSAEKIKEIPAADVAPVRHAHRVDNSGFYYSCSECGGVLTYGGNYCPNCGARMDVKTEET